MLSSYDYIWENYNWKTYDYNDDDESDNDDDDDEDMIQKIVMVKTDEYEWWRTKLRYTYRITLTCVVNWALGQ